MKSLSLELFGAILGSPRDRTELYYGPVLRAMERFNIYGLEPTCGFLATTAIESNRLQSVEESLYYREPERIARLYLRLFDTNKDRVLTEDEIDMARPYVRNHAALSRLLYNGYHGRGLFQITWKENYQRVQDALGIQCVANPDLLLEPESAAMSAGWFWMAHGCNDVAHDIVAVTKKVNPALMHLSERTQAYDAAMEYLG